MSTAQGRRPVPGLSRANGQSTAELAMLLPVLVLIMLVVVQLGLLARDQLALHHAVQQAARRAALGPEQSVAQRAALAAGPSLDPARLEVGVSGGRSRGDLLTVRVRYRAATAVPLVGDVIGDVSMSSAAVVRVE